MDLPDDLPGIIEYRCGPVVRHALPRTPVSCYSSSGRTNAPEVCPTIPIGATAWRLASDTQWRKWSELPKHWLPFLQRKRGTVMDPRSEPKRVAWDVIQDGGGK